MATNSSPTVTMHDSEPFPLGKSLLKSLFDMEDEIAIGTPLTSSKPYLELGFITD